MKATETKVLDFLRKSAQFIIPIYQRTYSWTDKQCEKLWKDIIRSGRDDAIPGHFVGSVVYVEKGLYSHSSIPQLLVIDGQQRLTTISLIIAAVGRLIKKQGGIEGITQKKLTNYYLVNAEEDGELYFKLILTRSDKTSLKRIIEGKPLPDEASRRVRKNFEYFENKIHKGTVELDTVYKGLNKLLIVDIALNREHDNPQLIFESLNSTGLELSQADLVRNYVLMGLEPKQQNDLYNEYWFPMEQRFEHTEDTGLFDRFMRDYLTVKTRTIPNIREVYEAFKIYVSRTDVPPLPELVAEIDRYSRHYVAMALGKEEDKALREAFADISQLKVDVAYPLFLEFYEDYSKSDFSKEDFVDAIRIVESYVFRRAACGIPTNSLNKTFGNLGNRLDKKNYLESIRARFQLMDSYRRFPNDDEFRRELVAKDLYNFRSRNYWLRKLENAGHKEYVDIESYTIEHIMPQNENLSPEWRSALGKDWKEVQARYLHTIGNLTLTGYNSELSDRPFEEKRDMKGGFADSPIRLNQGLRKLDAWDEQAIILRGKKLAERACKVWESVSLPENVLAKYRPPPLDKNHLTGTPDVRVQDGHVKELFDQLCKHVRSGAKITSRAYLSLQSLAGCRV